MFNTAPTVSVGETPLPTVAAANRLPHADPSLVPFVALPPAELTHAATASASVLISFEEP